MMNSQFQNRIVRRIVWVLGVVLFLALQSSPGFADDLTISFDVNSGPGSGTISFDVTGSGFADRTLEDAESPSVEEIVGRWQLLEDATARMNVTTDAAQVYAGARSLIYAQSSNPASWDILIANDKKNIKNFKQLIYFMKANTAGVRTRLALVETSGEVWVQNQTFPVGTTYSVFGTDLDVNQFSVQSGTQVDSILDLTAIAKVRVITTGGSGSIVVDNLKLMITKAVDFSATGGPILVSRAKRPLNPIESGILANFEDASTSIVDGGSVTRSVLSTQPTFLSVSAINGLISNGLEIATVYKPQGGLSSEIYAGANAAKITIPFDSNPVSANNWGILLNEQQTDGAIQNPQTVSMDLSGWKYLTLAARKSAESDADVKFAVALVENGAANQQETWISSQMTLTAAQYQQFEIGLNTAAMRLVTENNGVIDNRTIDLSRIKSVYYFFYKTADNQVPQAIYLDEVVRAQTDTVAPNPGTLMLTNRVLSRGAFQMSLPITDGGGLAYSAKPTVSLILDGVPIDVKIMSYDNGVLRLSGAVPGTFTQSASAHLSISGIKDLAGNEASFSQDISYNPLFVPLPEGQTVLTFFDYGRKFTLEEGAASPVDDLFRLDLTDEPPFDAPLVRNTQIAGLNFTNGLSFGLTDVSVLQSSSGTLPGAGALAVNLDFGDGKNFDVPRGDSSSTANWGAILLHRNRDNSLFDLTGYKTLGFYAKVDGAPAPITMAIGFEEDNGVATTNERWISKKFTLSSGYTLYSVGLNPRALTLDTTGPAGGNQTFDTAKIKSVYYYIYRGDATGNATVYMDMVHTALDTVAPIVSEVTVNARPDSTFEINATIHDLGGLNETVPSVVLTSIDTAESIPVTVKQASDSLVVITGQLPVNAIPATLKVTGLVDLAGNSAEPFTTEIVIPGSSNGNNDDGFSVTKEGDVTKVTNFGVDQSNVSLLVQNHTISTELDFSRISNKLPNSTASMKLLFNFGTEADTTINGQPNWGSLVIQNKSDGSTYDFSNAQTLAVVAKSTAVAPQVEFAIAIQDQDNEVWVSPRVKLGQEFKQYGFGLNTQIFKQDVVNAVVANQQLDLKTIKNVFYFVYRNGVTGNATVWIDGLRGADDVDRPVYVSSTVDAYPLTGRFVIHPQFDELGGFSLAHTPLAQVIINGQSVSDVAVNFVNDKWEISGTVPSGINRAVATVTIKNITDYYGNVRDSVSGIILAWNNSVIPIHTLGTLAGLSLFTDRNTLAAGDGYAGLSLNFNANNSDPNTGEYNWGEGITITPTEEALQLLATYKNNTTAPLYLTYELKSSQATPVMTRLILVEKSVGGIREVWKQTSASRVSEKAYFTSGVTINELEFERDNTAGGPLNGRLDFDQIEWVQLLVERNEAPAEPINLSIKNIVLRKLDTRTAQYIEVLDQFDTTISTGTDDTESTRTVTGNLVPGTDHVVVILPDGTTQNATVDFDSGVWSIVIKDLAPGNNDIQVIFYAADGSVINLANGVIKYEPKPPVVPVSVPKLLAESVRTSVLSPAIYGLASEGAVQIRLYINGSPVQTTVPSPLTQALKVTSLLSTPKTIVASAEYPKYFVFTNVKYDWSRDNLITVTAVDANGIETVQTSAVTIKWGTRSALQIPGASSGGGPIYVDFPVGSLLNDVLPAIDTSRNPKDYPINVAYRRLSAGPASLVDISISEKLQPGTYAIVSIPLPADATEMVQPWYYNPAINTWTQEGISDVKIVSRAEVDGVADTDEKYVRFHVSHFSLYGILEVTDQFAPTVNRVTFDDKVIETGDWVDASAKIKFTIMEPQAGDSGVGAWSIKIVKINTTTLATSDVTGVNNSGNGNGAAGSSVVTANLNLNQLESGRYYAQLTVADLNNNTTVLNSPTFNVEAGFQVTQLLNGPNPFNPNRQKTKIQYQLSQDADVKIYIYSISGEKLWETQIASGEKNGTSGFNSIEWDGRNKYGEMVSNGVYIAYVVGDNGHEKIVKKIKIAVLK